MAPYAWYGVLDISQAWPISTKPFRKQRRAAVNVILMNALDWSLSIYVDDYFTIKSFFTLTDILPGYNELNVPKQRGHAISDDIIHTFKDLEWKPP